MKYLSVTAFAEKWGLTGRSVRGYCADGRIAGAFLTGKTWNIPENAEKPMRSVKKSFASGNLLDILKEQKDSRLQNGIYQRIQIELTYHSNSIEGNALTYEQTEYILKTNTIGFVGGDVNVDNILKTANHFRCVDLVIDSASCKITEKYIRQLYGILMSGMSYANGFLTKNNEAELKKMLAEYNSKENVTADDILDFHVRLQQIQLFCAGNGVLARLIMFKECLKNNIEPFIVDEKYKYFYYQGLAAWETEREYLKNTCLLAKNDFKKILEEYKIGN